MVIAIILWGILFYLAMIFTSKSLVMLSFFMAAYLVLSCILLWIRRRGMRCDLQIPISVMDEGGKLPLEIKLDAGTFFGSSRLRFDLVVRSTFTGKRKRVRVKAVQEKQGKSVYTYMLSLPEAGNYEVSLQRVRFYDICGILSLKRRQKAHRTIQVLPKLHQVPMQITQEVRRFYGESEIYDEERAGTEPGELFGFRPFENGDRLQNIHWKLSAKEDELIVRENSLPKACAVVLFLDYRGKFVRKQSVGQFLETAGSLSFSLLDKECPHYVSWYNEKTQDMTRIRVDDEEGFYTFLARYLTEQGSGAPEPVRELYREKYTTEHYLHSLLLTQEMVLYQDEEKLAELSGKDGMKRLEEMEIVV